MIKKALNSKNPFEALADLDMQSVEVLEDVPLALNTLLNEEILEGNREDAEMDRVSLDIPKGAEGVGKESLFVLGGNVENHLAENSLKNQFLAESNDAVVFNQRSLISEKKSQNSNIMEVDGSKQEAFPFILGGNMENHLAENTSKNQILKENNDVVIVNQSVLISEKNSQNSNGMKVDGSEQGAFPFI